MDGAQVTDVVAQAKEVLDRSCIFELRRLEIEKDGGRLLLSGRVRSFYHKQLAQELVRNAIEGMEIANAISVVYRPDDELDRSW